jgi:hypothetical protein
VLEHKGEKTFIQHFKIKEMAWKTYSIVIGIVYFIYYALNIAYDMFVYYRHKKKETSNIYEVSSLFEQSIKPTEVNSELNEPKEVAEIGTMPSMQEGNETKPMTIEAFLKDVNRANSSIVSDIYQ